MERLVLEIDRSEEKKALSLPYRNVHVVYCLDTNKQKIFKNVLVSHGKYINTMKLASGFFFSIELLPLISNITELCLKEYSASMVPKKCKIDFPNLKTLTLLEASPFVDHICSHKIERLKVEEISSPCQINYKGDWNRFFKSCDNLQHLSMEDFKRNLDFCDFGFKLSSIEIIKHTRGHRVYSGYGEDDDFDDINEIEDDEQEFSSYTFEETLFELLKLIKAQKDSLKMILLTVDVLNDPDIFNFMINEMKLEELIFDVRRPVKVVEQKDNSTLKKLKINFKNGVPQSFLDILKPLQAVEHFDVDSLSKNILRFLHDHMPNLKTLTISSCVRLSYRDDESNLKANQVETLIIHNLPLAYRKELLTIAPNIKKLFIKGKNDVDQLHPSEFKLILVLLPKLEELICGTIKIDDEVLALIPQSKLRRITIEYQYSDSSQVTKTCEKLKTAHPRLIVMSTQISRY